jgi:cytochrome c556
MMPMLFHPPHRVLLARLAICLAICLATCVAMGAPVVAPAAEEVSVDRIDLVCNELPMRAVSFGTSGEVSYGEQPPPESEPVRVNVTKTMPGEDVKFDYATIDSSAEDLAATDAIWISGKQVEAQQGRFKINLENLMITLTEPSPDGSARFRRFQCERSRSAAGDASSE